MYLLSQYEHTDGSNPTKQYYFLIGQSGSQVPAIDLSISRFLIALRNFSTRNPIPSPELLLHRKQGSQFWRQWPASFPLHCTYQFLAITIMVHRPLPNGYANQDYKPDDLEAAISASRRKPRFKDTVNAAVHDDFHAELKRKLKNEVNREELEKYRKSISELKGIKDKKIRGFYEQQNERLNDWLEVDTLVMSMADDVLDSMNPRDADGDGVAEIGGMLKTTNGDIDPLLPKDERERRKTGEKRAKWAINVWSCS